MSPRRPWSPGQIRPTLPRWSGAECAECADPVEIVVLDADPLIDSGKRIAIERKVINTRPEPGMVAHRVVGQSLHGYLITKLRPLAAGYQASPTHLSACSEAPPPPHEQGSLFDTTEGNTTP